MPSNHPHNPKATQPVPLQPVPNHPRLQIKGLSSSISHPEIPRFCVIGISCKPLRTRQIAETERDRRPASPLRFLRCLEFSGQSRELGRRCPKWGYRSGWMALWFLMFLIYHTFPPKKAIWGSLSLFGGLSWFIMENPP